MSSLWPRFTESNESRLKSVIKKLVEKIIRGFLFVIRYGKSEITTFLEQFKETNKYNGKEDEEVIRELIEETYKYFKDVKSSDEITEEDIRNQLRGELRVAQYQHLQEEEAKQDKRPTRFTTTQSDRQNAAIFNEDPEDIQALNEAFIKSAPEEWKKLLEKWAQEKANESKVGGKKRKTRKQKKSKRKSRKARKSRKRRR